MSVTLALNPLLKIDEEVLYAPVPNWQPVDLTQVDTKALAKHKLAGTNLTLVCGVSTAGKDTLVKAALPHLPNLKLLPRATSRPPRSGEKDGVDYFFKLDKTLLWSEYGGHFYAVTEQVMRKLAQDRNSIQIQGLLYGLALKDLLTPLGVKVQIIYILPAKISQNFLGSIRVVLSRLYIRHKEVADLRLPSITRELKFVFDQFKTLKEKGVIFVENSPSSTTPNPRALSQFISLLLTKHQSVDTENSAGHH